MIQSEKEVDGIEKRAEQRCLWGSTGQCDRRRGANQSTSRDRVSDINSLVQASFFNRRYKKI